MSVIVKLRDRDGEFIVRKLEYDTLYLRYKPEAKIYGPNRFKTSISNVKWVFELRSDTSLDDVWIRFRILEVLKPKKQPVVSIVSDTTPIEEPEESPLTPEELREYEQAAYDACVKEEVYFEDIYPEDYPEDCYGEYNALIHSLKSKIAELEIEIEKLKSQR